MCDADRVIQATDDQITADSRVVISTVAAFLVYFSSIYSAKVKPVVDKAFAEKLATASHDENCVSL